MLTPALQEINVHLLISPVRGLWSLGQEMLHCGQLHVSTCFCGHWGCRIWMLLVDKLFCFLASEKSNMRDSFFCLDLNRRSDFFSREMSRFCLRLSSRLNRFLSSLESLCLCLWLSLLCLRLRRLLLLSRLLTRSLLRRLLPPPSLSCVSLLSSWAHLILFSRLSPCLHCLRCLRPRFLILLLVLLSRTLLLFSLVMW